MTTIYKNDVKSAMVGGVISGFWLIFSSWGFTSPFRIIVCCGGLLLGCVTLIFGRQLKASAPDGGKSLFRQRGYVLTVVAEAVVIAVGGVALRSIDNTLGMSVAWTASVVGLHFLILARITSVPRFAPLGGALLLDGIIAMVFGLLFGGHAAFLIASLGSAALLSISSWAVLVRAVHNQQ